MTDLLQTAAPVPTVSLRQARSLDGVWDFRHESQADWCEAVVPMPWQYLPGLHWSFGRATYRRTFTVPAEWADGQIVLHFGAVSDVATVRVNGTEVASHRGAWSPFEAVLPPEILTEANVVEVDCLMPDGRHLENGDDFAEMPHGKQSWYVFHPGTLHRSPPSATVHRKVCAS